MPCLKREDALSQSSELCEGDFAVADTEVSFAHLFTYQTIDGGIGGLGQDE